MQPHTAIVTVEGGVANVAYLGEKVSLLVLDLDTKPVFTLPSQESVVITAINEDGTVNVRVVEDAEGNPTSRRLIGVQVENLEWLCDDAEDRWADFDEEEMEEL